MCHKERRFAMIAANRTWPELASQCACTTAHVRRVMSGEVRDARVEKHIARCCDLPVEAMFEPVPSPTLPAVVDTRWAKLGETNE